MAITDSTQFGRVGRFRFWCQKVLPAVYDDSLSYYELLCKVMNWLEELTEEVNTQTDAITELQELVQQFLDHDFDPIIAEAVEEWFEENEPEITAEIEALQLRVSALEDELGDLKPYSYFSGHNVVFIGDSYTYGTGCSDHLHGDTKRFSSVLASMLEATEFNYGVGSTGFCDPGSGGQNAPFPTQLDNAYAGMTATQRNNTHLVVIAGGINDFNEGSTYSFTNMYTAAASCASKAVSYFPNALVLFVPMLFKGHDGNPRLIHFEDAIVAGVNGTYGKHKRCVCIKGAWTWNWGAVGNMASDELHPNDNGHQNIAARIYANIWGGSAYQDDLNTMYWDEGFTSDVAHGGYQMLLNGIMCMYGTTVYNDNDLVADDAIKIGHVGTGATPLVNISGIMQKGTRIIGTWLITTNGNLYIRPDSSLEANAGFYLSPIAYIPAGRLS